MIDPELLRILKEKYKDLPPLLLHRSSEKAATAGDLFDILSTIPERYPVVWNDETRRWEHTSDLTQSYRFDFTCMESGRK